MSTVSLGFELKTEQLLIVEIFWQVFSMDICFDKSKSMDINQCTCMLVFLEITSIAAIIFPINLKY